MKNYLEEQQNRMVQPNVNTGIAMPRKSKPGSRKSISLTIYNAAEKLAKTADKFE